VQAVIIPIADRHLDYVKQIHAQMRQARIRVDIDDRPERMNAKIRDAQNQKIPYMLVIGDREMQNGQVALRLRSGEDLGAMTVEAFIEKALVDIREHK
jgi:threonyl-tRNA synthetase